MRHCLIATASDGREDSVREATTSPLSPISGSSHYTSHNPGAMDEGDAMDMLDDRMAGRDVDAGKALTFLDPSMYIRHASEGIGRDDRPEPTADEQLDTPGSQQVADGESGGEDGPTDLQAADLQAAEVVGLGEMNEPEESPSGLLQRALADGAFVSVALSSDTTLAHMRQTDDEYLPSQDSRDRTSDVSEDTSMGDDEMEGEPSRQVCGHSCAQAMRRPILTSSWR